MIDLHCHILPSLDDGPATLAESLSMARVSVAGGVTTVVCTPHILPGLYHNSGPEIRLAVASLQKAIDERGIPLRLLPGADNRIAPDFVAALKSGKLLTLADSRYVLVEPPHHVALVGLDRFFFDLLTAGYVPILTHPERLGWIEQHYSLIRRLQYSGVWLQITAASLTGKFGKKPRYWAERMLEEGLVHILASDAHTAVSRPPNLAEGHDLAAKLIGEKEAERLVLIRPQGVLANMPPSSLPAPLGHQAFIASEKAFFERGGK